MPGVQWKLDFLLFLFLEITIELLFFLFCKMESSQTQRFDWSSSENKAAWQPYKARWGSALEILPYAWATAPYLVPFVFPK